METKQYILNKYKIEDQGQQVIEIPNIGRDQMAELFSELNFKNGLEVGVFKGKYSEVLCQKNPQAQIYGVDPWELAAHPAGVFVNGESQHFFDKCYQETLDRMAPYKNYVILKQYSADAAKGFADNSLDFVYIDAGHDFLNFTIDLASWLPKVKTGGIMSGHDFAYYPFEKYIHVKSVLLTYTRCYNIHPIFVAGSQAKGEGLIRDRYRSWFFVK